MQSIKRDITAGSVIVALTLACALAWGSPFVATSPEPAPSQANQTQESQAQANQTQGQQKQFLKVSLSGKIAKQGDGYVLRAYDGQTYKLSNAGPAAAFVGKAVTVTGMLDSHSMTITVRNITRGEE